MEVISFPISYKSRATVYRLYPLGDIHAGIKHCSERLVKKLVQQIANEPHALWVGMGDYAECITPSDPRWDAKVIADWVDPDNIAECQTEWVVDLLSPIKNKCVGLLEGNHEDTIRLKGHADVIKNLCKRLGVPNLGYSCFVHFIFRRTTPEGHDSWLMKGFFTHGAGCAVTPGAKLTRLCRMVDAFDADLYCHGHVHDIITTTRPYLGTTQAMKIKQKVRIGAMTGSWLKTYEQGVRASYGEKRNYPPTVLGCPVFVIRPDKQSIKLEET